MDFGFLLDWIFWFFFGLDLLVFLDLDFRFFLGSGSFGFSGIGCYPLTEQIWQRLVGSENLFDKGQPGSDKGQIYPMKEGEKDAYNKPYNLSFKSFIPSEAGFSIEIRLNKEEVYGTFLSTMNLGIDQGA